jgi:hypothetical protein
MPTFYCVSVYVMPFGLFDSNSSNGTVMFDSIVCIALFSIWKFAQQQQQSSLNPPMMGYSKRRSFPATNTGGWAGWWENDATLLRRLLDLLFFVNRADCTS